MMEVLYQRCAGIDVHKKMVVVCVLISDLNPDQLAKLAAQNQGVPYKEVRTFSTMVKELLALGDWLHELGCTHVVMESTASYTPPTMLPKL